MPIRVLSRLSGGSPEEFQDLGVSKGASSRLLVNLDMVNTGVVAHFHALFAKLFGGAGRTRGVDGGTGPPLGGRPPAYLRHLRAFTVGVYSHRASE
jgi:hypothetical protein